MLPDTFILYLKTHNFHWNVEGPQFIALHKLFEEQYRDLWNSLDDIAERIRALGQPAPCTTAKFKELAEIKENDRVPRATEMLRELMGRQRNGRADDSRRTFDRSGRGRTPGRLSREASVDDQKYDGIMSRFIGLSVPHGAATRLGLTDV